ncbi:hypothetical protein [Pseudoalteromonas umbrosa]|uniref:hypothetical protein n=1 Tax=Pseudoalteromonas umbrosa TaxID=3048489 RepID=UPI0024C27BB1|nr:hypothetical protein [Pseudoalteromonas sp. B95]MDK1287993.1 hypothetical protein [Pseudoalteromonas sp. B95]
MIEWFTSLSTELQIGALTLLVTIIGVLVAIVTRVSNLDKNTFVFRHPKVS